MDNRRQNYRFVFPADERPWVDVVVGGATHRAQVLDLGVQGIRVRLDDCPTPPALDAAVVIHLSLPRLRSPLTINGSVVYLERADDVLDFGIFFRPLLLPGANSEREKTLWSYLMDEQRRSRKARATSGARLRLFTGR